MLATPAFDGLTHSPTFISKLGFAWVDESHVVRPQCKSYREAFGAISVLRSRFTHHRLVWGAMSASLAAGNTRVEIAHLLGFTPGSYEDVALNVDRTDLKYGTRFIRYSTGDTFPDLACVIPHGATQPSDIPRSLIACQTVGKVTKIVDWFDGNEDILPADFPCRSQIVMPYTAVMSDSDRTWIQESLAAGGPIRIAVASPAGEVGLDLDVDIVYVFEFDFDKGDPESNSQWGGRAGRHKTAMSPQPRMVLFAPDWMRIEGVLDLDGDPALKKKPMAAQTLANRQKRRDAANQTLVQYMNPLPPDCCRDVSCKYYDVECIKPPHCCEQCEPDVEYPLAIEAYLSRAAERTSKNAPRPPLPKGDANHPPLHKEHKATVTRELEKWRLDRWSSMAATRNRPPTFFLSNSAIHNLVEKIHVASTLELLERLMGRWNQWEEWGHDLFEAVTLLYSKYTRLANAANVEAERIKAVAATRHQKKRAPPIDDALEGGSGDDENLSETARPMRKPGKKGKRSGGDDSEEVEVDPTIAMTLMQRRQGEGASKRTLRMTERAQYSVGGKS